jgi:DNA polymerase III delta prime subunit
VLEDLLQQKKVPSPLIVEGPQANEWLEKIAYFSLCESQSNCGECSSCKMLSKGFHPDHLHLETPKMDELRQKLRELRSKPFKSSVRVFTLSQFDQTNSHVQNALLKTLEEPLLHWIIAIGVNSRFTLLDTIRSRCLLYRSSGISDQIELSDGEEKIFRLIEGGQGFELYQALETTLKSREKTKEVFHNLLKKASTKNYPGYWRNMAGPMEESQADLLRNLNPKIVWERIWSQSQLNS